MVIAASMWGKAKTVSQMTMVIILLLHFDWPYYNYLELASIIVATALTVISLVDYLIKSLKAYIFATTFFVNELRL